MNRKKALTKAQKKQEKIITLEKIFGAEKQYNKFYDRVGVAYKVFEFVLIAVLAVYAVFSLLFNSEALTNTELSLIFREFSDKLEENMYSAGEIDYTPDENMQFAEIGDSIAVVGSSGVRVFSASGRNTLDIRQPFYTPIVKNSDDHLLVYDLGGNEIWVYNTFYEVYSEALDGAVRLADMSDDGYLIVVTDTSDIASNVVMYNTKFKKIRRYNSTKLITAADVSNGGDVLTLSVGVSAGGLYDVELNYYLKDSDNVTFSMSVLESMPLDCSITEDGFCVLYEDKLAFYSFDGAILNEVDVDARRLSGHILSADGVFLAVCENAVKREHSYTVFSGNGEVVANAEISGTYLKSAMVEANAFILSDKMLYRLSPDGLTFTRVSGVSSSDKLIASHPGGVYRLTDTSAIYYNNFDKAEN